MGAVRLVVHGGEPACQVKRGRVLPVRSQPQQLEVPDGAPEDFFQELGGHSGATSAGMDVQVADTTHAWILAVGVAVEPADPDELSVSARCQQDLALAIEPVSARLPGVTQRREGTEVLTFAGCHELGKVSRQRLERLDQEQHIGSSGSFFDSARQPE